MNKIVLVNIIRFIMLVLIQVLVLKNLNFGGGSFLEMLHFIIYPLFILLLPHDMPKWMVILLGFLMGITIDVFYNTYGVHASATVMTAMFRSTILKILEPKGGFPKGQSPTRYRLGNMQFLRYILIMLGIHIIWYHSMELFTPLHIGQILLRSIISFPISVCLIMIHAFLVNPKN